MWRGGLGASMDFATSTHRRRWLYTRSKLEEERRRLQQAVVDGLRRQRAAADPLEPEAGSATKRPREDPQPVSLVGELLMLKYSQQIIQEKCREMRMPVKVMSTAIQYHKRFFLRHTSMEFDPGRVMITAIFMATKVEERYTRAADIAAAFDVSEDLVVKQEVALMEGLNFDLVVHSPYRALHGMILVVDEACRAAGGALDALMLSDAPLLYSPAQVAAAALRSGFKAKGVRIPNFIARLAMKAALRAAEGEEGVGVDGGAGAEAAGAQNDPVTALTSVLDELDRLGSEGARRVEVDEVKEANAVARQWRSLLKDTTGGAAAGAGKGGGGGGAVADEAARVAKREAKKAARAAAKAKEAELLGMPQRQ
ncbi:hypothetical protein VOLCADRAFT_121058 [Volvox carteri f. nagariensis]|uniref:Cyclin-like domain-containing protein n=1 Tax=Volvox carteri f. nagariensis TaxID=3068 RepID=D8U0Y2_VOLCA|nr:uncharacterized protein VOLCADRAFT_121058 [Volvox carteri f. nagariensis]EFJ46540.1 hypothetical protein VOLCADRAFT_121058 [Volvox carteri f. nagariensis]|eukprot:XP_002952397.1 hypothetical protein VOLCADRAFT_121058 [Volvox carteri f. nagariensis]